MELVIGLSLLFIGCVVVLVVMIRNVRPDLYVQGQTRPPPSEPHDP